MSNTNNKKKIVGISIISAIIVMLSSIFIYANVVKPQKYSNYLDLGNKYLLEENYEEAILAFEKAIKIDEKSTEARVGVAKAYIGINDVDNAVLYLEQAQNLDKTNESLLKEIINILIPVDSELAYEFLDKFINEVGEGNTSEYINNLINESKELPSELKVSPAEGKYIKPISVKLDLDKMKIGHSYYYTLDGTNPNKESTKYLGKIDIKESTTVKLIGYNKNNESTEVLTLEYVIDKNIIKDVKSIITEGENLVKNTTVGTKVGNISKEDKDKLQFIISEAKDLVNQDSSTYENVSNIKGKLEKGINEFKNNIIKPVDKSKLKSAIDSATSLYNNAVEGSNSGQYKSGSKEKLMSAINTAKEIYNDSLAKQDKVDNATSNLNSSINTFKNSEVTGKSAALKAYYNFLKSYKFDSYSDSSSRGFNLAYINNDSIPELIVFDGDYHAAGVKVYAYVNGKVKYVDEFGEWGVFEYQEKKGVICSSYSGMGNYYSTYYKWSGSKLSTIMSSSAIEEVSSNGDFGYKYYINDKEVTRSKYDSSIAPYEKGFKSVGLSSSYAVTDSVMKDKLLK